MSKRVARGLRGIVRGLTSVMSPWRQSLTLALLSEYLYQRHSVETKYGKLTFVCPSYHAVLYPREFFTRETDTLEWIDSFESNSVFWDVGANVGIYALYAGLSGKSEVVAFEPTASTFATLIDNINENNLTDIVRGYPIAVAEALSLDMLNMENATSGSVSHSFGDTPTFIGRELETQVRQSTMGYSIDSLIETFGFAPPDYVKIDVDGIEPRIIEGAGKTFSSGGVREVLIEVEGEPRSTSNLAMFETMKGYGFTEHNYDFDAVRDVKTANVIFKRS
jgi:FkbM family methyltransferase